MTAGEVGSDAWLDQVFDAAVKDELFDGHDPDQASPVLVLLGGLPAAGKTRAQRAILNEHAADDLVEITGDDLREFHPDYARLAEQAPFEMPAATAPVSGGLVARALDHAYRQRYSVLLEGTFRDPRMVTATATRFADAGYRVEVVAVATPAPVSRLSAEMRSLDIGYPAVGRWTPPGAHETALERSPEVVAALERLSQIARVQVFSRERLLYANTRTDSGEWEQPATAARVFRAEQHRRLDDREAAQWLADYAEVFRKATERPGYLGAETAPTYLRLQDDAQRMTQARMFTPGAPVGVWQREQTDRRTLLVRVLPAEVFPKRSTPEHDSLHRDPPSSGRQPPGIGR